MFQSQQTAVGLPLRRFRPPISASVELHRNRPVAIRSPLLQGRILQSAGPWRSSGDWWDKHFWQRDEWDIQAANGRLYRLFRDQDGWFIDAIYD